MSPGDQEINPNHKADDGWIWLGGWSEQNHFGKLNSFGEGTTRTFAAKSARGSFSTTIGSRYATWNGVSLGLGFAPKLIHGRPAMHYLDVKKSFEPLLKTEVEFRKGSGRVIVIDPGHGGKKNTGARSITNSDWEKDLTLDWALRVRPMLAAIGWNVWLTRTVDQELSSNERIAFADSVKADLYVSLHFNSSPRTTSGSGNGGLETYCLTPTGMPSNLTRDFDDNPEIVYPNNAFDIQNLQLAMRMHRAMIQLTGRKDRGVRRARFMTVLQGQKRPAVLLEGGFLTDDEESRLIASSEYRQKLAEALVFALK
ncbi:MAG: N-acetylmuramoyl-L-alanine amidase [Verrucomicrobia bacterium]|nr:N-acetylmuramoyl-L-alanine amidase [Verrucomicrobiota bacterium]